MRDLRSGGNTMTATEHDLSAAEQFAALVSITRRMNGFLYRSRNDAEYTMLYMSDGISTVSGYPPSDFLHNRVRSFASVIHSDDLTRVNVSIEAALAAGRNWHMDYRIVRSNGEAVWVREIGGGIENEVGDLIYAEGFVVDIGDRKFVEDANDKLLKELQSTNAELSAKTQALELAKQRSDHSANHDLLTDLPNRRYFHRRLTRAIDRSDSTGIAIGLLFIDLDKFKDVNDTLGHDAGDALLQEVANSLRSLLRADDFVARLGGDEFAFLFAADPLSVRENALGVARRIMAKLQCRVPSAERVIHVGCTVGVAIYPDDARDSRELLSLADRMMYYGKKSGRSCLMSAHELSSILRQLPKQAEFVGPPIGT